MPQAVLLGSAQDGGVPQAGCVCATCTAAWAEPALRRLVCSLGLLDEQAGEFFLIDATPDFPAQLQYMSEHARRKAADATAGPARFAGILLTHAHVGHYTGLIHLGREAMDARGLPLYASERLLDFLRGNAPWRQLVELGNVDLRPVVPGAELRLSDALAVTPLPVPHRAEWSDTLAYLIRGPRRTLLYLPDIDRWDAWDRPLRPLIESFDVALLDGTFYSADELPGRDMRAIPHPLVQDTAARLRGLRRDVRFIHLNHTNPLLREGEERRRLESAGFCVGEAGDAWDL